MFYKHPMPNNSFATPEQLQSMALFEAWRISVTEDNTFAVTWVKIFKGVAEKQAEREEEAARVAATIKFAHWLQEGPAKGLRRQHRYTRLV